MSRASVWISAMRLRTLPLSISGIILAGCLAAYKNVFDGLLFTLAILTTLSLQILSNLANDYGDGVKGTDNDDRIGPERAIQSGEISPKQMKRAITLNIVITAILVLGMIFYAFSSKYLLYIIAFIILGGAAIIAAIKYTVGDSAYGYRGLGDLFVFVFFGLVSVIGGYFLFSKQLDCVTLLPACVIGLLSTAVLNLNNMRDIDSDRKSNKNTLVVKMGGKKAKVYHFVLVGFAILFSTIFGVYHYNKPVNLLFVLAFIPLVTHLLKVYRTNDPKLYDPELKKLALSTVVLAVFLGVGLLL